ncbi:hypothetical protein GQ457_04G016940 [Hibiscus cannabinus]
MHVVTHVTNANELRPSLLVSKEDPQNPNQVKDNPLGSGSLHAVGIGVVSDNVQHDVAIDEHLSSHVQSEYRNNIGDLDIVVVGNRESYASMVARNPVGVWDSGVPSMFSNDDVVVLDEDCIIDRSSGFLSIKFSDHVHNQIDRNMRNTVINENDYTRALTEGPRTIFGSYLTVEPWSREFSTSEKHPSHVIV